MALERTQKIQEVINNNYEQAANKNYIQTGSANYQFSFWYEYIHNDTSNAYAIETKKLLEKSSNINILDIGCGDGQFLKSHHNPEKNICVYGISANDPYALWSGIDYRTFKMIPLERHENHFIGNAENLASIEDINTRKYNIILSRYTLLHFTDPLLAVKQAYELLENDGLLLIDTLPLHGLNTDQFLYELHKNGYQFIATRMSPYLIEPLPVSDDMGALSSLMIKKTKPTLELQVEYDCLIFNNMRIKYKHTEFSDVNYQDKSFIMKISDNDFIRAYALKELFNLDALTITNNPKISSDIGFKILNDETITPIRHYDGLPILEKSNVRMSTSAKGIYNIIDMHIRANQYDKLEGSMNYYYSETEVFLKMPDAYGKMPIHLIIEKDSLEMFKLLLKRDPLLVDQKTATEIPMSTLEYAQKYNELLGGSEIYKYIVEQKLLPLQKASSLNAQSTLFKRNTAQITEEIKTTDEVASPVYE